MVKTILFIFLISFSAQTLAQVNWDNPPVLCPEETMPKGYECPDLSNVGDPYVDFPAHFSEEEKYDWNFNKAADLKLCRHKEILRREKEKPGTYSEGTLKSAWLVVDGGKDIPEKLDALFKASAEFQIPPQILIGALKQESLLSSIGVQPDGGNYSCGIAQLNINEWCESVNGMSAEEKTMLGWPVIQCDTKLLPTESVKAFYEVALKKSTMSKPGYQMTAADYESIGPGDVNVPENVFFAVKSYLNHCQDFRISIRFKAKILKALFENFVPTAIKNNETYEKGKTFARSCERPYPSVHFPLHSGWLLATAMYNAGPVQAKIVGHYFKVQNYQFPLINPQELIESLHWGGKWKEGTDTLIFYDQKGKEYSQKWLKSCIVQRHVARVIQHVTVPGNEIVKSLEQDGCKTTVPLYRQLSSGVKETIPFRE